jgi:signal transduction histidine kinase/CheY-like chemotaxis protein
VKQWRFFNRSSLSQQLLIRCALVMLAGTIISESIAYYYVRRGLEHEIATEANAITQALEFSTEGLLNSEDGSSLKRVLQNYATLPAVIEVAILDPSRKPLGYSSIYLQTHPLAWTKTPAAADLLRKTTQTGVPGTLQIQIAGKLALIQVIPFSSTLFAKTGQRGLAITVIDKAEIYRDILHVWILSILIMTSGILAVLVIISWLINRFVHEPINALNKSVAASQSIGSFQIPSGLPKNEVLFLAETFDQVFRAEQEAYEQLRLSNDDLARATRLKDEFLANMSHELRTPLNAILGLSEGCLEGIYGVLDHRISVAMSTIQQSGEHLLDLINSILDFAKIQSGKVDLQVASTDIDCLCRSSLVFVKHLATQKKISLVTDIPNDLGSCYVDELRIRQVLINLLSNALKFTPDGGEVTLTVQRNPETNSLNIRVIDTGIGIAPQHLTSIFEAFVQVDGKFNRQYAGTGLGLTLVKQITELHQGRVEVSSRLGEGSCFTVILPYPGNLAFPGDLPQALLAGDRPTLPSAALNPIGEPYTRIHPQTFSDPNQTPQPPKPLILIIEENTANLETFSDYLSIKGYLLIIADSGQEGIRLTQLHKPDLILMDIQVSGVSGLDVIQQLRSIPEFEQLPIIALAPLASNADRDRWVAAGVNQYLVKPIKLRQLHEVIQQTLASAQSL